LKAGRNGLEEKLRIEFPITHMTIKAKVEDDIIKNRNENLHKIEYEC